MKTPPARRGVVLCFLLVIGFTGGYSFRVWTDWMAEREGPAAAGAPRDGGRSTAAAPDSGSPDIATLHDRRPGETEESWGATRSDRPDDERREDFRNPFEGVPRQEIQERLVAAAARHDPEGVELAARALGPLDPDEAESLRLAIQNATHPETVELLAHSLVRFGGAEGLAIVAELALDASLSWSSRIAVVESLGAVPPERSPEGQRVLASLLREGLPRRLLFPAAHAYGRVLGEGAVEGLLRLSAEDGVQAEPILEALHEFVGPGDVSRLLAALDTPGGARAHEVLLGVIGRAAGPEGGAILLGLLAAPPPGVRPEAIGRAVAEFAGSEDLPQLWDSLETNPTKQVRAALARALVRVGGESALQDLIEISQDPGSGVSVDELAVAVAESAAPDKIPVMSGLIGEVRDWEAAERLASEIVELEGREGVDRLLELIGQTRSEETRSAVIEVIERFGDSSAVDRLATLLETERDHRVAFHLAKAVLNLDPTLGPAALAGRISTFSGGDQRAALADVLQREGDSSLIPPLLGALGQEDYGRAQWHLARAVSSYGPQGVEAIREFALADGSPQRRAEVLRGLDSVEPGAASKLAEALLEDSSPEVRHSAVEVLGHQDTPSTREALERALLQEAHEGVRHHLEEVLRETADAPP